MAHIIFFKYLRVGVIIWGDFSWEGVEKLYCKGETYGISGLGDQTEKYTVTYIYIRIPLLIS